MAAVAVVIEELAAGDLLRIEAEFGIGLAAFDVAARGKAQGQRGEGGQQENWKKFAGWFSCRCHCELFNHKC